MFYPATNATTKRKTSLERVPWHPWKIAQEDSLIARLLGWALVLLAAALPIEAVLRQIISGPVRSLPFYLSILCTGLALLRLPDVLRRFVQIRGMVMITVAFGWAGLVYYVFPMRSHSEVTTIIQLVIMAAMFMYMAINPVWRQRLLWGYWVGWIALTLLSLQEYLTHSADLWVEGDIVRAEGLLGFGTNIHAYHIGVGILITLALLRTNKSLLVRVISIAMLMVSSLVLLFGNSKGATLGLLLIIALSVIINSRFTDGKPTTFLARGLLALLLILGLYLLFTELELAQQLLGNSVTRIQALFTEGDFSSRDFLAERSLEMAYRYPFGVGQGNSMVLLSQFTPDHRLIDTHNYYLRMLIDGGILAFLLFVAGLALVVRNGWRWYMRSGMDTYFWPLVYVLWAAALSGGAFHNKFIWFFIAMNAVTPLLALRNAPAAEADALPAEAA
jgi:O-antigen ligase